MYEVRIENGSSPEVIHSKGVHGSKLPSAEISDAKNAISSFSFTIYPDNPGYDELNVRTTKVTVRNVLRGRDDFVGRIIQITPCMDGDGSVYKSVFCESRLGYTCDTIQPYTEPRQYTGDDTRNGLQEFIDVVLANHNSQVEDSKKIYRGDVSVITYESSEGIYKGLNYETTWDILKTKILDVFGGEMRLRESEGILFLDYAVELGTTRSTTIELGKNMQSAQRAVDSTGIVTRLIPLGAKLTKQVVDDTGAMTDVETEERLTIASVNDGLLYLEDETAVALYGYVYRTVVFDGVTDATNLRNKGLQYMADSNVLVENNTVEALDLSLLGLDIDDFVVYDKYPVRNPLIGLYATLEIVSKRTNVVDPGSSSFEMGAISVSMTDSILGDFQEIEGDVQHIVETEIKNNNSYLITVVNRTVESSLQQTEESIIAQVSETTVSKTEYETFSETVRHILQMDAEGTTMIFQIINEAIEEVGNTSESHYAEILKYIRFEDGNIILGEHGNPLVLKLENDRIAFLQNGGAVAYLTENKLFITNGEFTETLMVGKFRCHPRENGNTTWKVI